jgi:hypothetical protein
MQDSQERWKQLCEQASKEQDPKKLMELIAEINRLLAAKEKRLKGEASADPSNKKPET